MEMALFHHAVYWRHSASCTNIFVETFRLHAPIFMEMQIGGTYNHISQIVFC